ncbi:MAG: tetratricopeptide repeat protein [Nitrospirota bacterium]|nr:tetratricopeptide repeat protein [Nitrospirota bacterium]MDE3242256.1 tetratricopeptide repeat protein [Nitrospirota bacterium]
MWFLFLWTVLPAQAQEALEVYELNYSRGAMAFGLGHYEQAEQFFRAALAAKPDDPEASHYLGQSLLRRKQYAEAESVFRRMLALDASSGPAWLGLGIVQYHQKQYAEAKASLLAAEKVAPEDPLVHLFLGLVHHELGEFEAAPDRFQRAATLSPDLAPTAQYYSGVAHFRRGAYTEAKQTLEAAVAAAPEAEADYVAAARDLLAQAHEAPKDRLREVGAPRALGLGLGGAQVGPGQDLTASKDGSAGVDQAQGGGDSGNTGKSSTAAQPRSQAVTHAHAQTPPSVHSGASNRLLLPDERGPLRGETRVRK